MNYEQNRADTGLDGNRSERVPSLFAVFIDAVFANEAILVFEYERSQFEADSMFAPVLAVLPLIPFVAHLYIQIVLQKSRNRQPRRPGRACSRFLLQMR